MKTSNEMILQVNNVMLLLKLRRELEPIGYSVKMHRKTKAGSLTENIILHIKWSKENKEEGKPHKDYSMIEFHKDKLTVSKVLGDDYPITHWALARYFTTSIQTKFKAKFPQKKKTTYNFLEQVPARSFLMAI